MWNRIKKTPIAFALCIIAIIVISFMITVLMGKDWTTCEDIHPMKFEMGQMVTTKLSSKEGMVIKTYYNPGCSATYRIKFYIEGQGYEEDWFAEFELIYDGVEKEKKY